MKSIEIEIAVARMFGIRQNVIVPNVSWGLGLHECDLLIVRRASGYAIEVEIKTTKADLKRENGKRHSHESNKIRQLYFAVPAKLADFAAEFLPGQTGIISIVEINGRLKAKETRAAAPRIGSRPLDAKERLTVATLGTMRIWSLKEKIVAYSKVKK